MYMYLYIAYRLAEEFKKKDKGNNNFRKKQFFRYPRCLIHDTKKTYKNII